MEHHEFGDYYRVSDVDAELTRLRAELARVQGGGEILVDLWRYFDERADADCSGDPAELRSNVEMRMRDDIERQLRRVGYRKCDIAACNCGSWHRTSLPTPPSPSRELEMARLAKFEDEYRRTGDALASCVPAAGLRNIGHVLELRKVRDRILALDGDPTP